MLDETNVSAEPSPAQEDARLPGADEDQGRPEGVEATAGQGTETADGVTGRLPRRERLTKGADFQALFQRGNRIERSSVIVLWRETGVSRRAGFAVTRQIRGAVDRNRARRRLREAYRRARSAAPDGIDLIVIAKASAVRANFSELVSDVRRGFDAIPAARSGA